MDFSDGTKSKIIGAKDDIVLPHGGTMFVFPSNRDEKDCIEYVLELCRKKNNSLGESKVNQLEALEKVIQAFEERKSLLEDQKEDTPKWDEEALSDLIDDLITGLSGIDPKLREYVDSENDIDGNWQPADVFQWGEWRLNKNRKITGDDGKPLGYSDELSAVVAPQGGNSTIQVYHSIPEAISWTLTEIQQKKVKFLIGKAKVSEINATCTVPALPEELDSQSTGLRVLDRTLAQDEWQRRVNAKRILSIAEFINSPNNIIANSAILFCPPERGSVSFGEQGKVTVDFEKFLRPLAHKNDTWNYSDHDMTEQAPGDLRPLWLIDGQHRTRGLAQSSSGCNLEIPIILFTDEFSLMESAKVFAEINTLQQKLDALHTLFMQHRFQIPSPNKKRDFRPYDINNADTWSSRQNHLAYECAGWLASHEGGPLYGRIKILEPNQPRFTIIKANSWVDYSRSWYSESGPYNTECDMLDEEIFQEVENYFQAFVNISNHEGWVDADGNPEPRWSPNSRNKGLMQFHSTSRVLLDIYNTVWEKARLKTRKKIIPTKVFEEVLSPLKWADWRDDDVQARYKGSGERPRTSLRIWVETAIKHGEQYSLDQVMSRSLKSQPGRGLLAPPSDATIEVLSPQQWPSDGVGNEVILVSSRPAHALKTGRWTIKDSSGKMRNPSGGFKIQAGNEDISQIKIKWEPYIDNVHSLLVRVEWSNVNSPDGHGEITLTRPS